METTFSLGIRNRLAPDTTIDIHLDRLYGNEPIVFLQRGSNHGYEELDILISTKRIKDMVLTNEELQFLLDYKPLFDVLTEIPPISILREGLKLTQKKGKKHANS